MSYAQVSGTGNGRQNFRIKPSNSPPDNVFAYSGNPNLSFQLPSANLLLDPTSLRLTGKLRFTNPDDLDPANISIDQYLGVSSCFDAVSWSSMLSRNVIEKVNNYQKLIQSVLPAIKSGDNFQSDLQAEGLGTAELSFQRNTIITQMMGTDGVAFSTPIYTGLSMASGNRLPLIKIGGLILTLDLASDEAVFLVQDGTAPKYQLVDVSLTGSYYSPSPEERMGIMGMKNGTLELNTFTSLFSVLQSSQHTSQFNLGLKEVIACYFSFVPSSYINNYTANQFQALRVSNADGLTEQIVKLNFLRNGSQMPLLYDLDVGSGSNEAELMRYYMMSLKRLRELTKTTISSDSTDPRWSIGSSSFALSTANQASSLNKLNYVLGVPYDIITGLSGANFSNQPLTINIDTDMSSATPNAIYFYVLAKTLVMYDESGIRVMS
jgi:hypothetical protein